MIFMNSIKNMNYKSFMNFMHFVNFIQQKFSFFYLLSVDGYTTDGGGTALCAAGATLAHLSVKQKVQFDWKFDLHSVKQTGRDRYMGGGGGVTEVALRG